MGTTIAEDMIDFGRKVLRCMRHDQGVARRLADQEGPRAGDMTDVSVGLCRAPYWKQFVAIMEDLEFEQIKLLLEGRLSLARKQGKA